MHNSLVHCTDALALTVLDVVCPTHILQWLLYPLTHGLSAAFTGKAHHVEASAFEEEDQLLVHKYRNLLVHVLFSRRFNGLLAARRDISFVYDAEALDWLDACIREACARRGKDLFIGKPLVSSEHWRLWEARFPDARFVVAWRPPVPQLTSLLALMEQLNLFTAHDLEHVVINGYVAASYRAVIEMRAERRHDARFFFAPFETWTRDPAKCASEMCAAFGLAARVRALPAKQEQDASADETARRRACVVRILRASWESTWRLIFEALAFDQEPVWGDAVLR